jgi:hypothetical protein
VIIGFRHCAREMRYASKEVMLTVRDLWKMTPLLPVRMLFADVLIIHELCYSLTGGKVND